MSGVTAVTAIAAGSAALKLGYEAEKLVAGSLPDKINMVKHWCHFTCALGALVTLITAVACAILFYYPLAIFFAALSLDFFCDLHFLHKFYPLHMLAEMVSQLAKRVQELYDQRKDAKKLEENLRFDLAKMITDSDKLKANYERVRDENSSLKKTVDELSSTRVAIEQSDKSMHDLVGQLTALAQQQKQGNQQAKLDRAAQEKALSDKVLLLAGVWKEREAKQKEALKQQEIDNKKRETEMADLKRLYAEGQRKIHELEGANAHVGRTVRAANKSIGRLEDLTGTAKQNIESLSTFLTARNSLTRRESDMLAHLTKLVTQLTATPSTNQ